MRFIARSIFFAALCALMFPNADFASAMSRSNIGSFAHTSPSPHSSINDAAGSIALAEANNPQQCSTYVSQISGFSRSLCTSDAWCSVFATWVWSKAGVTDLGGLNGYAGSYYDYGINHGSLHLASSGYSPQSGDAVLYVGSDGYNGVPSRDFYHVGIFVGGTASSPTVVNGNWGTPSKVVTVVNETSFADSGNDGNRAILYGYVSPPGGGGGGGGTP